MRDGTLLNVLRRCDAQYRNVVMHSIEITVKPVSLNDFCIAYKKRSE